MSRLIINLILVSNILFAQELIWKSTDGPLGGIIGDIAIGSMGEIYAGAYSYQSRNSGLYKSTDDGESWIKLESQFEDFDVNALFVDSKDNVWVGTNYQYRIYRSSDGGNTWEFSNNNFTDSKCYAIGESLDGVLFAGSGAGIYRSLDEGQNWEKVGDFSSYVIVSDSNNTIYVGGFSGLYYSPDNGSTWTEDEFFTGKDVAAITIDKNNNLYCGTGYYSDGDGLYFSSNSGQSWTQIGLEGIEILSLEFDSNENLFVGTNRHGLFKTTDVGQTWSIPQEGLYKKQIYRLKINENDEIFVGSEDEGVYKSTNGGSTFVQVGLPKSEVENFVFSGDSLIFAATYAGVQKYNRYSKKWQNIGLHRALSVTITPGNTIYATSAYEALQKTTDFGKNWEAVYPAGDSLYWGKVLAVNNDTLIYSSGILYVTTNGGESWDKVVYGNGVFSNSIEFKAGYLWITYYDFSDEKPKLLRSSDLGQTFDLVYSDYSGNDNSNPMYVLDNGYVFLVNGGADWGEINLSINSGVDWETILTTDNLHSYVYAENNGLIITGTQTIFSGDTSRVYISNNIGASWHSTSFPGKSRTYLTEIKKDKMNNYFFATSSGLYEVDIITAIEDEEEKLLNVFSISQNYPNPFNPSTTIKFSTPPSPYQGEGSSLSAGKVEVRLVVYDILGREIKTLLNKSMQPGSYEVEFDGSDLTSGVYFYVLETGGKRLSKKMLLIK